MHEIATKPRPQYEALLASAEQDALRARVLRQGKAMKAHVPALGFDDATSALGPGGALLAHADECVERLVAAGFVDGGWCDG